MVLHRYPPFTFHICRDYREMCEETAEYLAKRITDTPDAVLCTASGSTPLGVYDLLVEKILTEKLDVSRLTIVKLDEWLDMARGSKGTCEAQLVRQLVKPLGLRENQYISFDSEPDDPIEECERIRRRLADTIRIDIAILGLGKNGHLGFNEPAEELSSDCHITTLSRQSLEHPMVRDTNVPPSKGITLGMGDILRSRQIVLLVNGSAKAQQMKRLLSSGVTPWFPASFLTLHSDVRCYCDDDSASLMLNR